jgi:hypothetical protein
MAPQRAANSIVSSSAEVRASRHSQQLRRIDLKHRGVFAYDFQSQINQIGRVHKAAGFLSRLRG